MKNTNNNKNKVEQFGQAKLGNNGSEASKTKPKLHRKKGFAIIATLTILAVCAVMSVGLLSINSNSTRSSSNFDAKSKAEMGIKYGLQHAIGVLKESTDNDSFITFKLPDNGDDIADGKDSSLYYNAKWNESSKNWEYYRLFSKYDSANKTADYKFAGNKRLGDDNNNADKLGEEVNGKKTVNPSMNSSYYDNNDPLTVLKWQAAPRAEWVEISMPDRDPTEADNDDKDIDYNNEYTIRYRYWIEDLQGYLPVELAGNRGEDPTESDKEADSQRFPYGAYYMDRDMILSDGDFKDYALALEQQNLLYANLNDLGNNNFISTVPDKNKNKIYTRFHYVPGMVITDEDGKLHFKDEDNDNILDSGEKIYGPGEKIKSGTELKGYAYESPLKKAALYTLFDNEPNLDINSDEDQNEIDNDLLVASNLALTSDTLGLVMQTTGGSVSGYSNYKFSDNDRDTNGRLTDANAKAIEENFAAGIQPYLENPRIPFGELNIGGVYNDEYRNATHKNTNENGMKLNLNELLYGLQYKNKTEVSAVNAIANKISNNMPQFASRRKGGFREDYNKTLASSIIDYADIDAQSIRSGLDTDLSNAGYRGVDSFPVISELFFYIERKSATGNSVQLEVKPWLELWNPTNQFLEGRVKFDFKLHYSVQFGASSNKTSLYDIMSGDSPNGSSMSPNSTEMGPKNISLGPNEYKVIEFANSITLNVKFGQGVSDPDKKSIRLVFGDPTENNSDPSNYKLMWQPTYPVVKPYTIVDRTVYSYHLPTYNTYLFEEGYVATSGTYKDQVRPHILITSFYPGFTYGKNKPDYRNNQGDTLIGYYIYKPLKNFVYGGTSPDTSIWGRNVVNDYWSKTKKYIFGEVKYSRWTDGGHTADAYTSNCNNPTDANDVGKRGQGDQGYNSLTSSVYTSITSPIEVYNNLSSNEKEALGMKHHYPYAPWKLSNLGLYFSESELGNIHDPVMWELNSSNKNIISGSKKAEDEQKIPWNYPISNTDYSGGSEEFGGGNSLRIGRMEHPKFIADGVAASRLLDLFYAGKHLEKNDSDYSENYPRNVIRINGHVNVNTASRDVLRSILAGALRADPNISIYTGKGGYINKAMSSEGNNNMRISHLTENIIDPGNEDGEASNLADIIIKNRPYNSLSEVSQVTERITGIGIVGFGSKYAFNDQRTISTADSNGGENLIWDDRAAEEAFGRLYNSSTVRSRNYRVFIEAEVVKNTRSGKKNVLARMSKMQNIFIDVERNGKDGSIKDVNGIETFKPVEITYEKEL